MKPRIAIITYNRAFNYGGDLQCFALQYKLRSMGYSAEVLDVLRPTDKDYSHSVNDSYKFKTLYNYDEKFDRASKNKAILSRLLKNVFSLIYWKRKKRRNHVFKNFHGKYIIYSKEKFSSFSHLYECSNKMDYTHYITGSDQVWNYTYPFSIEPYFLTFVNKGIKISYAASIGHSDIPEQIESLYKDWLSNFSFISLREEQGVDLIRKITKRNDIFHVLDPTLLLTKNEWIESLDLMSNPSQVDNKQKKYVLVYLLSQSNYSIRIAIEIAKKLSCGVKVISSKFFNTYMNRQCQFILSESPKTFVSLFYNAEFVVTNSFHGTAFAINFNIPFYTTTRKNKRVNSRFISLLSICSLTNRLLYEEENFDVEINEKINFDYSNTVLKAQRMNSCSYLQNALQ